MDKGLSDALNVLENWLTEVFGVLIDTVLLPFRLIAGLFS